MVHALRKAASSLNPGGVILEVHDLVDPPRIEVHTNQSGIFAGQLLSNNNFENQRHADQAVGQVIEDGVVQSDLAVVFENYIRADTFDSLADWLDEEWESAYIPQGTRRKVIDLIAQSGEESEVVLRMVSRLMILKPAAKIT
jgi:hypothetical protein